MELQNADLAAEMANFDVTIQSTSQRLDELTAVMQEIRQALSPGAINFAGTPRPPANPSPAASDDVLSQWHWMTRPLVESIANGTFDIYDLPKLHRDQTLRDRHIQKNVEGVLQPLSGGKPIDTLKPEKRFYKKPEQPTTEVAIRSTLGADLYLVLGSFDDDTKLATVLAYINPLVSFLWYGGLVIAFGTAVTMWPGGVAAREPAYAPKRLGDRVAAD